MVNILVVEDRGKRGNAIAATVRRVQGKPGYSGPEFVVDTLETPALLQEEMRRSSTFYAGVIVDFSLGCHRDDETTHQDTFKRVIPGYGPIRVTTGMGVLDYLNSDYPKMKLWAMTTTDARHRILFQGAASLLFGARPLNYNDAVGVDESQAHFHNELSKSTHSLLPKDVAKAAYRIDRLLTEDRWITIKGPIRGRTSETPPLPTQKIATFAWLAALVQTPQGRGFGASKRWERDVYKKAVEYARLAPSDWGRLERNVFLDHHWKWNRHLQKLLKYSGTDDLVPGWPAVDPNATFLAAEARRDRQINQFDPYAQYMAEVPEVKEFFSASDVHAAVYRWLEQNR